MKASEVRELTDADIRARIVELEEERFRLKFRAATETLEDPLRLRHLRHDISRLHTVLRERALAAGAPRRGRKNRAAARRAAAAAGPAGEQQQQAPQAGAKGTGSAQGSGRRGGGRGAGATTTRGAR